MFKINRNSIFFSLGVVFFITMVLIIISFVILMMNNMHLEEKNTAKKYHPIVRIVMKECMMSEDMSKELKEELKSINFEVIEDKKYFENVLTYGRIKERFKRNEHMEGKIFEYQKSNYLYIETKCNHFLLKDKNEVKSNAPIIMGIFGFILASVLFVFFTTFKKLYPLKRLQQKVTALGDEDFDFEDFATTKKDEISLLALEFSKSAKKLQDTKEARNIFIRNIMHELKTPITKGKFLVELPNDTQNKALMEKVFYRLESLINEFAAIEEIMATKDLQKKGYFLSDIIDNAFDLMLNIDENIKVAVEDEKVDVNFKLFSIAIKNLLDNALKYSENNQAHIIASKGKIEVINEGKPLKYELNHYFEPFKKEIVASGGFGLGLYITNSIIKAHDFKFSYQYQEGKNVFIIEY